MYAVAIIIGLAVCLTTYYTIHRQQIVPVLASAAATMAALLIGKALPSVWQMDTELWHLFWFGSSFCGMNNNRWITLRSVGLVWLAYAVLFWLLHTHTPWPGGSMGSMAVLSVTLWILAAKLINRQQHPHPHA